LLKNCAANAAHGNAVLAVGLRAETLLQRFLLATTASSVFQQPPNIRANPPALRSSRSEGGCHPRKKTLLTDALATKEHKALREVFFMIFVIPRG